MARKFTTPILLPGDATVALEAVPKQQLDAHNHSATYQPLDSDLATIAGLTATTDNFIQSKSSAWASRTIAQVRTDLGITAEVIALGAIAPTNDDIIQRKAGAWANRTLAQLRTDLGDISNTLVDAKGDILTATAADTPARLAAGTNGQVLSAQSAQSTGLLWVTPAGGGLSKDWPALAGIPRTTAFPGIVQANGTTIPVPGYAFDAAAIETIFYCNWRATPYAGGDLIVELDWYADTASTNAVMWGAQMSAITTITDTQDIETDGLPTVTTVATTHLGTTGQRIHRSSITLTGAALDSVAAGDRCNLAISRQATNGSDTMAGDAILVGVTIRE